MENEAHLGFMESVAHVGICVRVFHPGVLAPIWSPPGQSCACTYRRLLPASEDDVLILLQPRVLDQLGRLIKHTALLKLEEVHQVVILLALELELNADLLLQLCHRRLPQKVHGIKKVRF